MASLTLTGQQFDESSVTESGSDQPTNARPGASHFIIGGQSFNCPTRLTAVRKSCPAFISSGDNCEASSLMVIFSPCCFSCSRYASSATFFPD